MKYDIDEKNKTISILKYSKEEIKISTDIQFDVEQKTKSFYWG
jgi:hypothetical protein